ncbi:unnamed protein product [Echinostoma caproni]|uniref:Uncharacterized protein n=1 Tax=Echinostoma caproni TaxID=27848 RepID=A0A183AZA0_9TREM|nr:unnamed protein product [Echinostoma caproni]
MEFHLRDRAEHVYAEAERVLAFYDLCCQKLAHLMNESQKSCAELYDCSCPELNQLIKICRSVQLVVCVCCARGVNWNTSINRFQSEYAVLGTPFHPTWFVHQPLKSFKRRTDETLAHLASLHN